MQCLLISYRRLAFLNLRSWTCPARGRYSCSLCNTLSRSAARSRSLNSHSSCFIRRELLCELDAGTPQAWTES